MKHHLIWLSVLACTNAGAVVGNGTGATYSEALRQAKVSALEKQAGTMVIHSAKTENDTHTSTTREYTGGVIVGYEVLNHSITNGLHTVSIDAEIKSGADNTVVAQGPVDQTWLKGFRAAQSNILKQKQFVNAFDDLPAFAVSHTGTKVRFNDRVVEYRVMYSVKWQPKLISDVLQYAELSGEKLSSPNMHTSHTLCFSEVSSTFSCYGIATPIPGVNRTYEIKLHAYQGDRPYQNSVTMPDAKLKLSANGVTVVFKDGQQHGEIVFYSNVSDKPIILDHLSVHPYKPASFR